MAQREQGTKTRTRLERLIGNLLPDVSGEKAHRARLLTATGLIIAAVGMLFLMIQLTTTIAIPSLPPAPWFDIATDIIVVFVGGLTVWIVRSARIRLAAWVVLSFLLVGATVQIVLNGHPPSSIAGSFGFFMVVALAVALLEQRRDQIFFTVAASVTFIGLHGLWLAGNLPPPTERGRNLSGQALYAIISWLTCSGAILLVIGTTISRLRDQTERLREQITERERTEDELRQRANQLALLNNIVNDIATELDVEKVLERAVQLVQEVLDYHHVALFTLDTAEKTLVMRSRAGAFGDISSFNHQVELGQGLVGRTGRQGEWLLANHFDVAPHSDNDSDTTTQSKLSVPVQIGRDLLGALAVQSPRENAFDENDMMVLETLADQIAVAIKNARLYEQAQQEIAEREQTEKALRQSEREKALILNATSEVFIHYNTELEIQWANKTAAKATGSNVEEMRGHHCYQVWHARDRPCEGCPVLKARESGEAQEAQVTTSEGRILSLRGYPVFEDDEMVGLVELGQDITARKRAEDKIRHYARELKRSNEELEQFAYVVSHDLQEPLRVAKGYLNLLAKYPTERLDTKAKQYIDRALEGINRMQEMIQALLDLSRVGTRGKKPAPTDVEAVLERTLKSLEWVIRDIKAKITYDPLPTVMADDAQLAQVFQNLIANAIKFRKEDVPPHVHVSAEREGDEWVFSVADNGIGIDPEQADRLFQIFQRLHTREEYEGLGIGLALCRRVVERHGGRIWVESGVGEGSTFYFTLPA